MNIIYEPVCVCVRACVSVNLNRHGNASNSCWWKRMASWMLFRHHTETVRLAIEWVCVCYLIWKGTSERANESKTHILRPFDRRTSTICIASQCHFSSLRKIQFYLPLFHIQTIVSLIVFVLFARFYAFSLHFFSCPHRVCVCLLRLRSMRLNTISILKYENIVHEVKQTKHRAAKEWLRTS